MTARRFLPSALALAFIMAAQASAAENPSAERPVRPSVCAGTWYPGDREALAGEVDALLEKAAPAAVAGRPVALIAPHAGYRFSAPVAAAAYRCLRGQAYRRVILLAFSHRHASAYTGVNVPVEWTAYDTPLGVVPIDREAADALRRAPGFVSHTGVDRAEHSLELQLPFLQRVLKDFALVPLLVGRMSAADHAEAARALLPWVDEHTLIVVSSDFTHFGPNYGYEPFTEDVPNRLSELAAQAAGAIRLVDFDGFNDHLTRTGDTICGRGPILLLLRILSMKGGAEGVLTASDTSGRMTGDWTNSVTYQSFVFTPRRGTLAEEERAVMLRLARQAVTAAINKREVPAPEPAELPETLRRPGACFVTLEKHGELRGCIGNMIAEGPLSEAVIRNAVSAATRDYRFVDTPITGPELPDIHIEISYLTPMQRITRPEQIIVGRRGLLISRGGRHGVLLPQVAYERGWTREEFLAQTCRKAGLAPETWRQPDAEIYSFEAEVFGEPETTSRPAATLH